MLESRGITEDHVFLPLPLLSFFCRATTIFQSLWGGVDVSIVIFFFFLTGTCKANIVDVCFHRDVCGFFWDAHVQSEP